MQYDSGIREWIWMLLMVLIKTKNKYGDRQWTVRCSVCVGNYNARPNAVTLLGTFPSTQETIILQTSLFKGALTCLQLRITTTREQTSVPVLRLTSLRTLHICVRCVSLIRTAVMELETETSPHFLNFELYDFYLISMSPVYHLIFASWVPELKNGLWPDILPLIAPGSSYRIMYVETLYIIKYRIEFFFRLHWHKHIHMDFFVTKRS
jgi:hypothetical protein